MNKPANIKHIYYFSFYGMESPTTRYRGRYVLDHLKLNYNISFTFVYPGYELKNIVSFFLIYFSVLLFRKKNSLIIFQKIYTSSIYATLLKILLLIRKQKTIYDIDDAEYLRFPDKTIKFFLKNCSSVIVGSSELLAYATKYNHKAFLLTSPVTTSNFIKVKRNDTLTIGWLGDYGTGIQISSGFSHKRSLNKILFPALKEIDIPIRVVIAGVHFTKDKQEIIDFFSSKKNIQIDIPLNIHWNDEGGIQKMIREFDIGVAPMVDHEFNRSKSAFKLKQYLSCGVPALVSPVGENNAFLKEGQNGYFCSTPEEFCQKILFFNNLKEEEYRKLSFNALKSVSEFNLDHFCKNFLALYTSPN